MFLHRNFSCKIGVISPSWLIFKYITQIIWLKNKFTSILSVKMIQFRTICILFLAVKKQGGKYAVARWTWRVECQSYFLYFDTIVKFVYVTEVN